MIDVMVAYPNTDTLFFDDAYYLEKHSPLVNSLLGEHGLRYLRVHRCIDPQAPYHLVAHLGFESVQRFESAFAKVGDQLLGDIANFTNVEPVLQVNEVVDTPA
ncbi:EthD family reductase [Halomonas sp. SH5A2]|uniref:EthD family reductase n=1 Tax=Halomonas sp. SH5A2 TaxID=2749040 RepID=UPI00163FDB58|nr:EthD family reductase [Halomonas sp. SH5A2]QNI03913.1 EthD family reductase [Halomonas sp. SH5A2]